MSFDPPSNPRSAYFDGIADRWDGWEDLETLPARLATGLDELGVGSDEAVLDVGCGTGNLAGALVARMSARGRVIAFDISPRMVEIARVKVPDSRVAWHVASVDRLPLEDDSVDRAICLSVWPHVEDEERALVELRRVLRKGGRVHLWHLIPRARVNEIHSNAAGPIASDLLPPADETARLLERMGFAVSTVVDDVRRYLVTAGKRAAA
jgi:demethylmenaquinone methyltransferase/2-methoxy-6-polyprenyl-1,4-benzoquinol methylase